MYCLINTIRSLIDKIVSLINHYFVPNSCGTSLPSGQPRLFQNARLLLSQMVIMLIKMRHVSYHFTAIKIIKIRHQVPRPKQLRDEFAEWAAAPVPKRAKGGGAPEEGSADAMRKVPLSLLLARSLSLSLSLAHTHTHTHISNSETLSRTTKHR